AFSRLKQGELAGDSIPVSTNQYPPLLELPPELDPEAAPSVWHPARETASETVRTASNIDAMRLKFICFPMNVGRARTNRRRDVRRS
ncbi:MAG: hypothetical protein QOJ04_5043, partial [Caballeronia sp.]|nr:hypothetical protein [Caballeronia sp.]